MNNNEFITELGKLTDDVSLLRKKVREEREKYGTSYDNLMPSIWAKNWLAQTRKQINEILRSA